MGLRINSNAEAFAAHRNLARTSDALSRSLGRLSSGLRINTAADDAAGLGVSERMRAEISGLAQSQRNAQDGISLAQVADGSLASMQSILQRVRELAIQFNSGSYSSVDKASITQEVAGLSAELSNIMLGTKFGGVALLSGGGVLLTLQIGNGNSNFTTISSSSAATAIGGIIGTFVGTAANVTIDLDAIDTAIGNITSIRGTFGGVANRLQYTVEDLATYQQNLSSAESQVRDLDMAEEMANYTRLSIMQQSGTAILAQANLVRQNLLLLLK